MAVVFMVVGFWFKNQTANNEQYMTFFIKEQINSINKVLLLIR